MYKNMKAENTNLLVVGAPRSGTTLLAAMIGRHSEVAMLSEHFGSAVKDVISKPIVGNKLCIPNQIEINAKRSRWVNLLPPRLFHLLHRYEYFQYRPEGQVSIIDYIQWGPLKIVGIVRDGNAVISSITERGGQSLDVAIYRWRRSIDILTELSDQLGDDFFLISFDQLVTQSENTMKAIAAFLSISFESEMLEGYAYTPNYSNQKIDSSKAKEKKIDMDLIQEYPDTFSKFTSLVSRSNANLAKRFDA